MRTYVCKHVFYCSCSSFIQTPFSAVFIFSGDGNLHLNITSKQFEQEIVDLMEPEVFKWTAALHGSISAEHGMGFKKNKFIHYAKSPTYLNLMENIKLVMDPKLILNPYKVLHL
ncbi:hypothetical protein PR048_023087 [Dryococelus australis]|uniref:D-2-hydroxyglutarate dehydrogenase, mitochondrial n=1 Tax=Dryococelus australis TaxID=614101 RepID=A0ABQ9GT24_9NEOP|nr:hypothetical protein PR048_023087 [Dryococelus australis]